MLFFTNMSIRTTIHNAPYTSMNTLVVLLHKGMVEAIEVWKSTTS